MTFINQVIEGKSVKNDSSVEDDSYFNEFLVINNKFTNEEIEEEIRKHDDLSGDDFFIVTKSYYFDESLAIGGKFKPRKDDYFDVIKEYTSTMEHDGSLNLNILYIENNFNISDYLCSRSEKDEDDVFNELKEYEEFLFNDEILNKRFFDENMQSCEDDIAFIWHIAHKDSIEDIIKKEILSNVKSDKKSSQFDIYSHNLKNFRAGRYKMYSKRPPEYFPIDINVKDPFIYIKKDDRRS